MILNLVQVTQVRGIYSANVPGLPLRMRWLHPDAAATFKPGAHLADKLVCSDMFRSPESSLQAVKEKRGAKPPSYSAHNYGLAIDVDVKKSMSAVGVDEKPAFDRIMQAYGWWCHRLDGLLEFESWHYNWLGLGYQLPANVKRTDGLIEAKIQQLYGSYFDMPAKEAQKLLAELRLYDGAIDGSIGPLSREAVKAFQRTWNLIQTGLLDTQTKRTLAYVTSSRPNSAR